MKKSLDYAAAETSMKILERFKLKVVGTCAVIIPT